MSCSLHDLNLLREGLETKQIELQKWKKAITVAKEEEQSYIDEIDRLQFRETAPILDTLRRKRKQLKEELLILNQHYDLELTSHSEEIEKLGNALGLLKDEPSGSRESDAEQLSNVASENLSYMNKIKEINDGFLRRQESIDKFQQQNSELCKYINNITDELENVKENLQCKNEQLTDAIELLNRARAELSDLNKVKEVVDHNSLFSEVNDKRLELQDSLIGFVEKSKVMRQDVLIIQRNIVQLGLCIQEFKSLLSNSKGQRSEQYTSLIDSFMNHIEVLKYLKEEYQIVIAEQTFFSEVGFPNNRIEFYNKVIREKRENEERLAKPIERANKTHMWMSMLTVDLKNIFEKWRTSEKKFQEELHDKRTYFEELKSKTMESIATKQPLTVCTSSTDRNKITVRDKPKSIMKQIQGDIAFSDKKVAFIAESNEVKPSSAPAVRKGGKILQCKSVFVFSSKKQTK